MSNTINDITHNYKGIYTDTTYEDYSVKEKSVELEDHLIGICNHLAEVEKLTGNNKLNADYLLTIVGSYVMGLQEGQLDETTEPPSALFETSLYPSLGNIGLEVEKIIDVEEVVYDDGNDSTTPIGDAPKKLTD